MATRPFDPTPTEYPGTARPWDVRRPQRSFWLGRAGRMIQLPFPSLGYTVTPSQGETVHDLPGGAVSVTRRPNSGASRMRRSWDLKWPPLSDQQVSTLNGFYLRLFGNSPWRFFNPEARNRLTLAQSMCGALNGVAEGWVTTGGSVDYDPTLTSPMDPCGVLRWSGANSADRLIAGLNISGAAADPKLSMPYVPAEPVSWSSLIWVEATTVTVTLGLLGMAADGTTVDTPVFGQTLVLSPVPVPLPALVVDPGALGSAYWVVPIIRCQENFAPDILMTSPQLEIGSDPTAFQEGQGTPRVTIPGGGSQTIDETFRTAPALTLGEVA